MCGKKMEYKGEGSSSQGIIHDFQSFQDQHQQLLGLHQEHHQATAAAQFATNQGHVVVGAHASTAAAAIAAAAGGGGGGPCEGFIFPSEVATLLPWALPPLHSSTITTTTTANNNNTVNNMNNNSNPIQDHGRLYASLPPPPPPPYGDFYTRRASAALQFGYEGALLPTDHLGLAGLYMAGGGPEACFRGGGLSSTTSPFSSLQSEFGKMTAQEIMDAKALAASKSHSEAERRRRERINAHLAKLRNLLPSTTKTDKASLLAEVIHHVKELKRQTSEIVEEGPLPTESDELTVDAANDEDGKFVVKASMCCDDRSDLLSELIKALKALRLRTLKAEITTLGGRVKNVLVITGEEESETIQLQHSITSIQDALKAVMERTTSEDPAAAATAGGSSIKRQRTTNLSSILENRSL